MARQKYGTTLWGSEFLKAIEHQTDSSRLSRGKTYANTNKVYDVVLNSKTISAKVKGNYSDYYSTAKNSHIRTLLSVLSGHHFGV